MLFHVLCLQYSEIRYGASDPIKFVQGFLQLFGESTQPLKMRLHLNHPQVHKHGSSHAIRYIVTSVADRSICHAMKNRIELNLKFKLLRSTTQQSRGRAQCYLCLCSERLWQRRVSLLSLNTKNGPAVTEVTKTGQATNGILFCRELTVS